MKKIYSFIVSLMISGVVLSQTQLAGTAQMVTHPGQGSAGADVSATQTTFLSMTLYGSNQNRAGAGSGFWIGEKITVPPSGWTIDSLITYGYQTGSGTTSTFTGLMCYICKDSTNSTPSSTLVVGSKTTNAMVYSNWTGIYRTPTDGNLTDSQRPIMKIRSNLTGTLSAGVYWVVWGATGSLTSGPWNPPVTILSQASTGNAVQSNTAGVFNPIMDGSNSQGMPFKLFGSAPLSISQVKAEVNSIAVIPNPVSEKATVKIELSPDAEINFSDLKFSVYDQLGKQVMNYTNINSSFDIERGSLSSGVYFYKLLNKSSGKTLNSGKLVLD